MSENQGMTAMPSPCISVCQLDPVSGQCLGCYRTSAEIAAWRSMSAEAVSYTHLTLPTICSV